MSKGKRSLRAELRRARRRIDGDRAREAAQQLAENLADFGPVAQARHIGLYLALDGEIDPASFAARRSPDQTLYLPVIIGQQLHFAPWHPGEDLTPNRYGIGEPSRPVVDDSELDLLLIPVVGFSADGTRLGMGGGFYDRFLGRKGTAHVLRVGLAYECQRCEALATVREPWDASLDFIVTERGVFGGSEPASRRATRLWPDR